VVVEEASETERKEVSPLWEPLSGMEEAKESAAQSRRTEGRVGRGDGVVSDRSDVPGRSGGEETWLWFGRRRTSAKRRKRRSELREQRRGQVHILTCCKAERSHRNDLNE
jgi:hypothetical protein